MKLKSFKKKFRPIENHFTANALHGFMFNLSDKELEFVAAQEPSKVWTVITGDAAGDDFIAVPGFARCNRIGHIICETPWNCQDLEVKIA